LSAGDESFDLMCAHDLEGIVAKRLADPYDPRVRWLKIKIPSIHRRKAEATCSRGRGSHPVECPHGQHQLVVTI
jgi:hypothetical protein